MKTCKIHQIIIYLLVAAAAFCAPCCAQAESFTEQLWKDSFDTNLNYHLSFTPPAAMLDPDFGNSAPSRKIEQGSFFIYENESIGYKLEGGRGIYNISADFCVKKYASGMILAPSDYQSANHAFELWIEGKELLLRAYDASGASDLYSVAHFEKEKFFNFCYRISFPSGEIAFYFNGKRILPQKQFLVNAACTNIVRVFRITKEIPTDVYIDNFTVERDLLSEKIAFSDNYSADSNINLPLITTDDAIIKWQYGNLSAVNNNLIIYPQAGEVTEIISASVTQNGREAKRDYYLTIPPSNSESLASLIEFENIQTDAEHITLPQTTVNNIPLYWTSENNNLIDGYGNINRQPENTSVTLTATFISGGVSFSKDYVINLVGYKNSLNPYCVDKSFTIDGARMSFRAHLFAPNKTTGNLIISSYNDKNKMLGCVIADFTTENEKTVIIENSADIPVGAVKVKVFMLEKENIVPIYKNSVYTANIPSKLYLVLGSGTIMPKIAVNGDDFKKDFPIFMNENFAAFTTENEEYDVLNKFLTLYENKRGIMLLPHLGNTAKSLNENTGAIYNLVKNMDIAGIIYTAGAEGEYSDSIYEEATHLAAFAARLRNAMGRQIPIVVCEAPEEAAKLNASLRSVPSMIEKCVCVDVSESANNTQTVQKLEEAFVQADM